MTTFWKGFLTEKAMETPTRVQDQSSMHYSVLQNITKVNGRWLESVSHTHPILRGFFWISILIWGGGVKWLSQRKKFLACSTCPLLVETNMFYNWMNGAPCFGMLHNWLPGSTKPVMEWLTLCRPIVFLAHLCQLHGGLICVAFCLSVRLCGLYQK